MVSTIAIKSDGTYALDASVGLDRLTYGTWKETFRYGKGKIDLYMDDDLGGDSKKWASAIVTTEGLKIYGATFIQGNVLLLVSAKQMEHINLICSICLKIYRYPFYSTGTASALT